MAIEYDWRTDTRLEAEQVLELLRGALRGTGEDDSSLGPVLTITAAPESPVGRAVITEAFGFSSSVHVTFRLDKFEGLEMARAGMLRGVLGLFRRTAEDGVLLFNNEIVVLLGRGGRLILNGQSGFWSPERLVEVAMPYETRAFAPL